MSTRYTIDDLHEYAAYKEGKCLSTEYWDIETKYKWMCSKGHNWEAAFPVIKQGGWCPVCLKKKTKEDYLERLKAIAIERGGKCLSNEYINRITKLEFQCSKGHIWKTTSHSIVGNKWCPACAGVIKHTIKDIQELAAKRGGKCLSDKYIDNRTKLEFQCSKGHIWKAKPATIIINKWCRICGYKT